MMVEENGRNHSAESREWSNFCFVIDEVPMMTSRKICRQKRRAAVYDWLAGKLREKEHVVIVAVIPVSKYCTEMQKKKK